MGEQMNDSAIQEWIEEIYEFPFGGNDPERVDEEVSKPSIQKVPAYMRARGELEKFYVPKLISFGPIHMAKPYVDQGRPYKLRWTAMYLQQTNQTLGDIIHRISEIRQNMEILRGEYWRSLSREVSNREFCFETVLMVDGCSILQVLEKSVDYDYPEEELKVSIDQLVRVHQDMLLLENQIPYLVLKLICGDDKDRLKRCMRNFLHIHCVIVEAPYNRITTRNNNTTSMSSLEHSVKVDDEQEEDDDPIHLLDYLRRELLVRDRNQMIITKRRKSLNIHLLEYLRRRALLSTLGILWES